MWSWVNRIDNRFSTEKINYLIRIIGYSLLRMYERRIPFATDMDGDKILTSTVDSKYSLEYVFGFFCLLLLLPAAILSFGEYRDIIDYFEYGGDVNDIISWILYTATIFSILFISGLKFTGNIKSNNVRVGSGIFIILLSIVNLISRFSDFEEERKNIGFDGSWLEFLYWSSTHETLELVFLGIIIGFFILKK